MSRRAAWPPLLYLAVFFLVPTGLVAGYSCRQRDFAGEVGTAITAEGWRQATSPYTLAILARSLMLAVTVTAACLLLAYPCALTLSRVAARRRQAWVVLMAFPLVTSQLLRIYGWLNLLPLSWRGRTATVGLVMATVYFPFMVLPLLRACERADPDLYRAALDLGATPWRGFWHVIWPLTRPGVLAGCALVFIPATGEYLIPHFIGEGKVTVLGTLIVQQFTERRNWPYASAAAVCLLSIVAVPVVISAFGRGPLAPPGGRSGGPDDD
jgi:spermidine/putrescine transport system permease protein